MNAKKSALHVQDQDLKVAKAPTSTNSQDCRESEIDISSPQSCLTSAHLICLAHLRAFFCHTTRWQLLFFFQRCDKDPTNRFFLFFLVPFCPWKVSSSAAWGFLAYFEWCSFKVRAEKKTESEAGGMKMWAQPQWERGENQGQWKTDKQEK